MNLNAYDNVTDKLDRSKTWVDPKSKVLYSREIKFRKYVLITKQINNITKLIDYFLILLDDKPEGRTSSYTRKDDYGRIKVRLNSIWEASNLHKVKVKSNINLEHREHTDDGDIYYIDV